MSFQLPTLGYDYRALEPFIDAQTMQLHHTAHHQAYVNKLNDALQSIGKGDWGDILQVQKTALAGPVAVRNNGGGHYNHSLFWKWMAPVGTSNAGPFGPLKAAIEEKWGCLANMQQEFNGAAATRFGSGWAWLTVDPARGGALEISSSANQDNPLMFAGTDHRIPILGLDVWEHAYYLKYQNRRPEYIQQWWNIVNWDKVVEGYEAYASKGNAVPISL